MPINETSLLKKIELLEAHADIVKQLTTEIKQMLETDANLKKSVLPLTKKQEEDKYIESIANGFGSRKQIIKKYGKNHQF